MLFGGSINNETTFEEISSRRTEKKSRFRLSKYLRAETLK